MSVIDCMVERGHDNPGEQSATAQFFLSPKHGMICRHAQNVLKGLLERMSKESSFLYCVSSALSGPDPEDKIAPDIEPKTNEKPYICEHLYSANCYAFDIVSE